MKEYIAEYIIPVVPADEKGKNIMFDFMNAKRLIRCKDCKHLGSYKSYGHYCENDIYVATGEEFCSWAERKEHETD